MAEVSSLPVAGSALSIDTDNNESLDVTGPPLDQRIIDIIKASPDLTLRPARLAAELGISVDDASAELCGLLRAVGAGEGGASFKFENMDKVFVMVFAFPPDFERRARRQHRQETFWKTLSGVATVAIKLIKIITAFGLILSLLIVSIAALAALAAAMVALTRAGHDSRNHRSTVMRQIRSLCMTMRQLLWFYAVFGGGGQDGQDPFMREIAYDVSLLFSVCGGSFSNVFFWFRANQLFRRRRRMFQGWSGRRVESDVEGVSLIRRGTWGHEEEEEAIAAAYSESGVDSHRGLLSVAVEFLFGPTPFHPGPSEQEAWKLRTAALLQLSTASGGRGVKLESIAPYTDSPPSSLEETASILVQALPIVAHFNGTPTGEQDEESLKESRFVFPELMAECSTVPRYESPTSNNDDGTWGSLLYAKESTYTGCQSDAPLPSYLKERPYKFTKLSAQQLAHCSSLGFLNLIGVIWLVRSISKGGILEIRDNTSLANLARIIMPILQFYAILFLYLPAMRLALILALNSARRRRNDTRVLLVKSLEAR